MKAVANSNGRSSRGQHNTEQLAVLRHYQRRLFAVIWYATAGLILQRTQFPKDLRHGADVQAEWPVTVDAFIPLKCQVRTQSFIAQPPDLRDLICCHESFAVACSFTRIGTALYPVY
jgi:hypothetical protein